MVLALLCPFRARKVRVSVILPHPLLTTWFLATCSPGPWTLCLFWLVHQFCLFVLFASLCPINNLSVKHGRVLLKDHNAVTTVRLEPAASRSRVKHSTTEPLCSWSSSDRSRYGSRGYWSPCDRSNHLEIYLDLCSVPGASVNRSRCSRFGLQMLDSIYHDIKITLKSHFCRKNIIILSLCTHGCYGRHNVSRKSVNH